MALQVISKNQLNILVVQQLFAISKIPYAAAVLPVNLVLYSKDLKLLVSAILALILVASSEEKTINFLLFQNN